MTKLAYAVMENPRYGDPDDGSRAYERWARTHTCADCTYSLETTHGDVVCLHPDEDPAEVDEWQRHTVAKLGCDVAEPEEGWVEWHRRRSDG